MRYNMDMTYDEVTQKLESLASHDPRDLAGMARFGINVDKAWVISIPKLRKLAKEIGKNHELALQVWDSGIHEARILAGFIDDPKLVTEKQMEHWVLDFDSWDVTDMICGNLFDRTQFAVKKAVEWSKRPEEFVKRAGFVIMAGLAVHNKKMEDAQFVEFLEIIKRESGDNRNFVRKAVNWALRTIGKSRNKYLYERALEASDEILKQVQDDRGGSSRADTRTINNSKLIRNSELETRNSARRFIAGDAMRELQKEYIRSRFL